ncbi:MAG: RuBisCO large subunit C-terminal-like domain-containing protein [Planctomycetia bacterium]|nr:RuBisCO large subunit C-terminal-like domain-containing protein [Planctomycetia bacterium]
MFFETFCNHALSAQLSGSRSQITYSITADTPEELHKKALDICAEQTVEFPVNLLPPGEIPEKILGQIVSLEYENDSENFLGIPHSVPVPPKVTAKVRISFADEVLTPELPQLLNVVYGNISIKPGIRVLSLNLSENLIQHFPGPRFGITGIRNLLQVHGRPLLFTALKPQGLSAEDLASLAYDFARGGMDIIKDDHGISNQTFSPFSQRVTACTAAIRRANDETGYRSIYVPNITAPHSEIIRRARYAQECGAGGVLISPGLTGFDILRELSSDPDFSLPIFMHPAFLGSFVLNTAGISHGCLFGQIARLSGADATIFPNFGGRFSFSHQECKEIAAAATQKMAHLSPIFPCPAGGMKIENVNRMLETYGTDVMLLIGGGLFSHGTNLRETCQFLRNNISCP